MSSRRREPAERAAVQVSFPQLALGSLGAPGVEVQAEAAGVYRLEVPVASA